MAKIDLSALAPGGIYDFDIKAGPVAATLTVRTHDPWDGSGIASMSVSTCLTRSQAVDYEDDILEGVRASIGRSASWSDGDWHRDANIPGVLSTLYSRGIGLPTSSKNTRRAAKPSRAKASR